MSSLLLAEYLDEEEAETLNEKLRAAGVEPVVKRHGLPFSLGVDINYKVIINSNDCEKAKNILSDVRRDLDKKKSEKKAQLSTQCPGCTSTDIVKKETLSLWQRVRFAGVEVRRCRSCGAEWYI